MTSTTLHRSALSAALLLGLSATCQAGSQPTAGTHLLPGSNTLEIRPSQAAPAFQLRVSGPDGQVVEESFLDGESLQLSPSRFGQGKWRDGSYRFELVPLLGVRQRGDAESAQWGGAAAGPDRVVSGSFQIVGGKLYAPTGAEAEAKPGLRADGGLVGPADVVNADDVIVQGSLCVGFDCINNESFGFDTLRLKENNLRIKFEDTSVGAFPSTDWQLTANDSASGGANKFSIEDITGAKVPFTLTAGAPTNSLFVDSSGRVGLRTATPVLDLHASTGNTPAIRLEQTGAQGWAPQTWDIAGNEANFFVRDVTGGSRLPLRIRPGAPTSSLDIGASGNVGMGSASPATALHVRRTSGSTALRLEVAGGTVPGAWDLALNSDSGRLNLTDDSTGARIPVKFGVAADNNLLRVGIPSANTVEVNGNLRVNGNIQVTGSVGPDFVFAPGFRLPSIGEHAQYMWEQRHLPRVGPARVNADGQGVIDLGTLSHGMLEELEYAHVYIAELDGTVRGLRQQLAEQDQALQQQLADKDGQLRQMRAELDAIKRALGVD